MPIGLLKKLLRSWFVIWTMYVMSFYQLSFPYNNRFVKKIKFTDFVRKFKKRRILARCYPHRTKKVPSNTITGIFFWDLKIPLDREREREAKKRWKVPPRNPPWQSRKNGLLSCFLSFITQFFSIPNFSPQVSLCIFLGRTNAWKYLYPFSQQQRRTRIKKNVRSH